MPYPGNFSTGVFANNVAIEELLAAGDVLQPYIIEEQWVTNAFVQSGIMALDERMNNTTGERVLLPFYKELNAHEEYVDSTALWGDSGAGYFTPQKTAAERQVATITNRCLAFAADDLSSVHSGTDPLAVIRSQMASELNRFIDKLFLYLKAFRWLS